MGSSLRFVGTLVLGSILPSALMADTNIYVSPSGNDSQSGTREAPLRSLERATQLAIESLEESKEQANDCFVWLAGGTYVLNEPWKLNGLTGAHGKLTISGLPNEKVIVKGPNASSTLVTKGNRELLTQLPVPSRNKVKVYQLNSPLHSPAPLEDAGNRELPPCPLSLYSKGMPMRIASSGTVSVDHRSKGTFAELDQPGEWCHDHESNKLVVWSHDSGDLEIPVFDTLFSIYDCQDVTIRNLQLEGARSMGVEVAGGSRVAIEDCRIRSCGNVGVHLFHGNSHTVRGCEVVATGSSGIRVEAGETTTLQHSEHHVVHNDVHHCCYHEIDSHPAIAVFGSGCEVVDNTIHDQPGPAVTICGYDLVVQKNDIHHVCLNSDDTGAIVAAGNPAYRGCQIRENWIHDVGHAGTEDIVGIYLDDFSSGVQVVQNRICRVPRGVVVAGGNDNSISQNTIYACKAGVQIDNRCASHGYESEEHAAHRETMLSAITPEILDVYPELHKLLGERPEYASGNQILGNQIDCPIGIDLQDGLTVDQVIVRENYRFRVESDKDSTDGLARR